MNAVFAAALVPIMFDTTRRLCGVEAARRVLPLVLLLPGFLLWPSLLLREASVLLLLAVVAWCGVRLTERSGPGALATLAVAIALLFVFRGYIAVITSGMVISGIALGHRHVSAGVATGVSTVALLASVVLGLGLGYSGYTASIKTDLKDAQAARTGFSTGTSTAIGVGAKISTPRDVLRFLPRAVPQFVFGPFPWQVRQARQLPALIDTIVWWGLIPVTWAGLRSAWRRLSRRLFPLLFVAGGITLAVSVVIGNYGTQIRERPQVLLFLVPFTALGLAERTAVKRARAEDRQRLATEQLKAQAARWRGAYA
jgi:hypothetical protein